MGQATLEGNKKNGNGFNEPVFIRNQIMAKLLTTASDGGASTLTHDEKYPVLGNAGLNIWIHANGADYTGTESIEIKLYKKEVINETTVYSEIGVLSGVTLATTSGDATKCNIEISSLIKYATHFSISATFTADADCNLKVVAERVNDVSKDTNYITGTTDSEWIIVDAESGSVTLDCTDNATCAGYVEVTIDKVAVDGGGTPVAEIWDAGTITNSVAHAQFGKIYAIRFVVTASTGHKLYVSV